MDKLTQMTRRAVSARMRFPLFLLSLLAFVVGPAQAAIVDSGNVKAELVSSVDTVVPGESFWIGLRQDIRPGWHTYWRNPGDSGAPTELIWSLPPGFEAGEIQWPVPKRIPYGPLMNFGYKGEVVFPVEITPPASLAGGMVTLDAKGEWLVCADVCIPEDADLTLTLPVGSDAGRNDRGADLIDTALASVPTSVDIPANARVEDEQIRLTVAVPGLMDGRMTAVRYFPFETDVIDNPAEQPWRLADGGLEIMLTPGYAFDETSRLDGVLVVEEDTPGREQSAFAISPTLAGAGGGQTTAASAPGISLPVAFLFAFIGGVILNLMPCVFPVLSIKILSLVGQVGSHSSAIRQHGWAYVAGVVLSFVAVAVVLVALRAGGAQIGWGFQLQSPVVVALLAYVFFLIGLNLFGFFELGGRLMNVGQGLADRGGLSGSFFTGVLATVVAAPCTVPFMASATGFALTQGNAVALAIFAALGLGMAAPYLLLCYWPAAMDRLPRPGPWMARFKELLAFPMFATALWLLWVLSQQVTGNSVMLTLGGMLMLAMAIWLWRHPAKLMWLRFTTSALGLLLVLGALSVPGTLDRPVAGSAEGASLATSASSGYSGPAWESYSPERLETRQEDGPVFVNFTAAWCITCKVNESVALDSGAVRQAFEDRGITYLKGDWTNEDPVITRALEAYQRSGVPLYLLYRPGEERATVLPQVLTESIVLRALEEL